MKKYELALVLTAKIDDEARAQLVEKAKGYITRAGGNLANIEVWGRKRLAYEIQYQREGYYYFIHFEAEPSAPALIERDVRIMNNVLRYLIVCQEEDFEIPETEEQSADGGRENKEVSADSAVESEKETAETAGVDEGESLNETAHASSDQA